MQAITRYIIHATFLCLHLGEWKLVTEVPRTEHQWSLISLSVTLSPHATPFTAQHRGTTRQVDELTADLHKRSGIPKHVEEMIRQFPKDMHAMSMFGAALFALQVRRSYG